MCDVAAAVESAPTASAATANGGRDCAGNISPDRLAFLRAFGSQGASNGKFNCPRLMACDHEGNIVVVDKSNHRLQVLRRSDGACLRTIGSFGEGPGQFNHPLDVAFDGAGNIIVADFYNNRLQVLCYADGSHVRTIGRHGFQGGELNSPCSVAVDGNGNVLVLDIGKRELDAFNHGRIQAFRISDGVYLRSMLLRTLNSNADGSARNGSVGSFHNGSVSSETRMAIRPSVDELTEQTSPVPGSQEVPGDQLTEAVHKSSAVQDTLHPARVSSTTFDRASSATFDRGTSAPVGRATSASFDSGSVDRGSISLGNSTGAREKVCEPRHVTHLSGYGSIAFDGQGNLVVVDGSLHRVLVLRYSDVAGDPSSSTVRQVPPPRPWQSGGAW